MAARLPGVTRLRRGLAARLPGVTRPTAADGQRASHQASITRQDLRDSGILRKSCPVIAEGSRVTAERLAFLAAECPCAALARQILRGIRFSRESCPVAGRVRLRPAGHRGSGHPETMRGWQGADSRVAVNAVSAIGDGCRRLPQSQHQAFSAPASRKTIYCMTSTSGAHLADGPRPSDFNLGAFASAIEAGRPFVARAALEHKLVTRYALGSRFRMLHPGVYVAGDAVLGTRDRIRAAGLWAPADATIAGWAAAHLFGERWYSHRHCARAVDIYSPRSLRPTDGVRVHATARAIPSSDRRKLGGLTTTGPARAAVDVARWMPGEDSRICAIDSICNSSKTTLADVADAAGRMAGQHGVSGVTALLSSCDPEAQSPQETELRLRIARSGLPVPKSQVQIFNEYGQKVATADLAYEEEKVAIFYDGRWHSREEQWLFDVYVNASLADLGWEVVRIAKGMIAGSGLEHIVRALERSRSKRGR